MYFDPAPKKSKNEIYNFDEEYNQIKNSLNDPTVRLIALYGLRRTGKTTLLNIFYNEFNGKKLYIDVRNIYPLTTISLSKYLTHHMTELIKEFNLADLFLSKIKGIDLGVKIELKDNELLLSELFEKLDTELSKKNQNLLIFIDEAQLLKQVNFDRFLAYIYDKLKNVKVIVAGSEIGMLDRLLGDNEDAPLFGRAIKRISIDRLNKVRALEFLEIGFKQVKFSVSSTDIEKAYEKLDGIIGWLTFFGWQTIQEKSVEKGISNTIKQGSKMAYSEFVEFLKNREPAKHRYLLILKSMTKESQRWRDIKNFLELREKNKISNKQLSNYLTSLVDYGFVQKDENQYSITDPLLGYAVNSE